MDNRGSPYIVGRGRFWGCCVVMLPYDGIVVVYFSVMFCGVYVVLRTRLSFHFVLLLPVSRIHYKRFEFLPLFVPCWKGPVKLLSS